MSQIFEEDRPGGLHSGLQENVGDDYFEFSGNEDQDAYVGRSPHVVGVGRGPGGLEGANAPDDAGYSRIVRIADGREVGGEDDAKDEGSEDGLEEGDDHNAVADREWQARKERLGLQGRTWHAGNYIGGAIGAGLTKLGAAGAQDKYTAGKVLGGIGAAAKGTVDTVKDLGKIGAGVTMNTLTNTQFAPYLRAPDVVKAGLQDGGALLEIAGRGVTAASGVRATDVADRQRRAYLDQRDTFVAARDSMRERMRNGGASRGAGLTAFRELVRQRLRAEDLGRGVNTWGVRPGYDYTMDASAAINNMTAVRSAHDRTLPNPSRPGEEMEVKGGEVTFERTPGTDPLNMSPEYQTRRERQAGTVAKALSAPGDAIVGLGKALDGTEHGQSAIREGNYAKGGVQATLAGARTIGKGAASIAAHPLGLGPMASALVDVGSVVTGGLVQAVGGGLNSIGGVGEKARTQRELESRNKHYFGKEHFIADSDEEGKDDAGEDVAAVDGSGSGSLEDWTEVGRDPYFDSARGREVAERGLRSREQHSEDNFERTDRDVGLPEVEHGGAVKNWWHNRMKRPLKKLGQGLLKPFALLAKIVGYGTGAIPLYNYFARRRRAEALAAAARAQAAGAGPAAPAPAAAPAPGAAPAPSPLERYQRRLEDLETAGSEKVAATLDEQRQDYGGSSMVAGARAGLKLPKRDLAKENIRAWASLHRRKAIVSDLVRQNTPDPVFGESFADRQRRDYRAWRAQRSGAGSLAQAPAGDMYEESDMRRLFDLGSRRKVVPAEMGMLGRAAGGAHRERQAIHPLDIDLDEVGRKAEKYQAQLGGGGQVDEEEKSEDSVDLENLEDDQDPVDLLGPGSGNPRSGVVGQTASVPDAGQGSPRTSAQLAQDFLNLPDDTYDIYQDEDKEGVRATNEGGLEDMNAFDRNEHLEIEDVDPMEEFKDESPTFQQMMARMRDVDGDAPKGHNRLNP